jgi:hydrogenase-4 membrane subunit HyfE
MTSRYEQRAVRPLIGWYAVFVLVVAAVFASLGLSDVQLRLLQDTGIAIFAARAAHPTAWLADRHDPSPPPAS